MVLYNVTEATFRGLSLTWFIFFIIAMKYPVAEYERDLQASDTRGLEEEEKLVYVPDEIWQPGFRASQP